MPPSPQFIEITGGYNAGRQCDYGDAKQGREYLQHPCQPQQAHEAEKLEGRIEQRNGRQDGQQVYDCHKRKRIGKERRLAIVVPNVSRTPPQHVVDDEHERRAEFRVPKRLVRLHEHKRQEAYENGKNHKPVVSRAYPVGMRLSVNNVCYLLSIHITK